MLQNMKLFISFLLVVMFGFFFFFFFYYLSTYEQGSGLDFFPLFHVTCNSFSVIMCCICWVFFLSFSVFGCFNQTVKVWMQKTCYVKLAAVPYFFMNSDIWRHGI